MEPWDAPDHLVGDGVDDAETLLDPPAAGMGLNAGTGAAAGAAPAGATRDGPPRATGVPVPWFTLGALAGALVGGWLFFTAPVPSFAVRAVRIVPKPGLDPWAMWHVRTPSLYATLVTPRGPVSTEMRKGTEIGSGMDLATDRPVDLAEVKEVQLWNKGVLPPVLTDTMWDRWDRGVTPGREADAAHFHVECLGAAGPSAPGRSLGGLLMVVCGAGFVVGAVRFLRSQVI